MAATLAELTSGKTRDDYKAEMAASLPSSFSVTTWRDGDVARTLLEIDAQALSDLSALVAKIARGSFVTADPGVTGADGAWLDLAAKNVYGIERKTALVTIGQATLTAAPGAGPYDIELGALWVGNGLGLRYTNTGDGTLSAGGTLSLSFQAESPGSAWNSAGALSLLTSLPGVTVSDLEILRPGTDDETDTALATRCQGQWAALGFGSPSAAYDAWVRSASNEVTRTLVGANGTTAGQVDIVLAGASGPVSAESIADVTAYLTPRIPLCSTVSVASVVATTIAVAGNVYVQSGYLATASAQALLSLQDLIASVPIAGIVYVDAIREVLMAAPGARNCPVTVNGGTADVTLAALHVAALDVSGLTFVGV